MYEIYGICKGGGYKYCRTIPPHPKRNSNNLYPLHRVLMENKLGRSLQPQEVVHHIDGDKNNNDPDNLMIMHWSDHSRQHQEEAAPPPVVLTCFCGRTIRIKPHLYRRRMKLSKFKTVTCSYRCSAYLQMSRNGGKLTRLKTEGSGDILGCPEVDRHQTPPS